MDIRGDLTDIIEAGKTHNTEGGLVLTLLRVVCIGVTAARENTRTEAKHDRRSFVTFALTLHGHLDDE